MATLFLGYAVFSPMESSVMLVGAGVTNSFLNFLPSIYLGAPSASTALSVLPGHEMLLKGRGYEAVRLTVIGGLISAALVFLTLPLTMASISAIYPMVEDYIYLILIAVIGYMFFVDRDLNAVGIFLLSGILGYVVLELNFVGTRYDLFPLLSGLFGVSMLLHSFLRDPEIPPQDRSIEYVDSETAVKGGLTGGIAGIFVGLLPGIGSAQATYLAQEISGKKDVRRFMVAIGGVNTSNIIFSMVALYIIDKARSGIAVSIGELIGEITLGSTIIFVLAALAAAGTGAAFTLYFGKRGVRIFRKVDYKKLCLSVIVFIFVMSFVLTGIRGVIVAAVGASLGLSCIMAGCRRSYLMGCVLFPVILYFL
jgi:putative membrane protein